MQRRKRGGLPVPREHGAWVVLYAPLIAAVAVVGRIDCTVVLFFIAVTGLFLAQEPLVRLARLDGRQTVEKSQQWRRWLFIYLFLSAGAVLPLLASYNRWYLIPLGGAGGVLAIARTFLIAKRVTENTLGELIGVMGLTLTAPGAYYVLEGRFDALAWLLWILNVLFFASGIYYVKMKIECFAGRSQDRSSRRKCALYHLLLVTIVALCIWQGWFPALVALAFLPVVARTVWGLASETSRLNLKRMGYTEIGFAVVFLIAVVIALRT